MVSTTKGGLAVGALLLAMILGNALSGMGSIGYHAECIDTIDNDLDGMVDGSDMECSEYPFSDGNGESHTPPEERSTSSDTYASLFEYHRDYLIDPERADTICFNLQFEPSNYNAQEVEAAELWATQEGVNCQGEGP